jgi:hypothetical protein
MTGAAAETPYRRGTDYERTSVELHPRRPNGLMDPQAPDSRKFSRELPALERRVAAARSGINSPQILPGTLRSRAHAPLDTGGDGTAGRF